MTVTVMNKDEVRSSSFIQDLCAYEMKHAKKSKLDKVIERLDVNLTDTDWSLLDTQDTDNSSLNEAYFILKKKWQDELKEKFRLKDSVIIAGGNYSFFYLLPEMMGEISKLYPAYESIRMMLVEPDKKEDFYKYDPDIILSGYMKGIRTRNFLHNIGSGFKAYAKFVEDNVYFHASEDMVEKYGSEKETLENHHLLFGRSYVDDRISERELNYPYSVVPENRKKKTPRVVMDQQYATHDLMKSGVGIWIDWESSPVRDGLVQMGKSLVTACRYPYYNLNSYSQNYKAARYVYEYLHLLYKKRKVNNEKNSKKVSANGSNVSDNIKVIIDNNKIKHVKSEI